MNVSIEMDEEDLGLPLYLVEHQGHPIGCLPTKLFHAAQIQILQDANRYRRDLADYIIREVSG